MSETTKEYFEREKQSRFNLLDYIDSGTNFVERLEIADKILGKDEVEKFVVYEEELNEDDQKVLDEYKTDRDGIDEAIKNYYEPLSIERRIKCNPRDPYDIQDRDDSKYKIMITFGGPNVFREIDWTAELHLYRGSDHYSRDFGRDVADKLLSFYGLE